jgi:cytochrome-b5 reductase
LYWLLGGSKPPLSPQYYSTQTISDSKAIAPGHKIVSISIPSSASQLFTSPYRRDGSQAEDGEIVVQHIMVGAPDIQIERPYTFVNDPIVDRDAQMVVKRVKGGEVGRSALQPFDAFPY